MCVPAVYSLNGVVSGRYENYRDLGGIGVPDVSLVYRPIPDLALRGGYGMSYTAPTVFQTYSTNGVYTPYRPIAIGANEGTITILRGSSPHLDFSTATTWAAGVQYVPKGNCLEGLA